MGGGTVKWGKYTWEKIQNSKIQNIKNYNKIEKYKKSDRLKA